MAGGLRAVRREVSSSRAMFMVTASTRVTALERITPWFRRVHTAGPDLAAYTDPRPADAFRLVPGGETLGAPVTRALTVSSAGPGDGISLDVLDHGGGLLAPWLDALAVGDEVPLLGMRTEFVAVPGVTRHLLVADGAGLPAVAAILASLPVGVPATVVVRVPDEGDRTLLAPRPGDDVRWIDGPLAEAVRDVAPTGELVQGFVAAEGSEVRALRRDLVSRGVVERDLLRASAYWWAGSTGDEFDHVARPAWERARDEGLDTDDPIVVDEILAEGVEA